MLWNFPRGQTVLSSIVDKEERLLVCDTYCGRVTLYLLECGCGDWNLKTDSWPTTRENIIIIGISYWLGRDDDAFPSHFYGVSDVTRTESRKDEGACLLMSINHLL